MTGLDAPNREVNRRTVAEASRAPLAEVEQLEKEELLKVAAKLGSETNFQRSFNLRIIIGKCVGYDEADREVLRVKFSSEEFVFT